GDCDRDVGNAFEPGYDYFDCELTRRSRMGGGESLPLWGDLGRERIFCATKEESADRRDSRTVR
ncbi:MAG: hypothetical protein WA744_16110, partial [Candidatus Acidiferrales bacterium]